MLTGIISAQESHFPGLISFVLFLKTNSKL